MDITDLIVMSKHRAPVDTNELTQCPWEGR